MRISLASISYTTFKISSYFNYVYWGIYHMSICSFCHELQNIFFSLYVSHLLRKHLLLAGEIPLKYYILSMPRHGAHLHI